LRRSGEELLATTEHHGDIAEKWFTQCVINADCGTLDDINGEVSGSKFIFVNCDKEERIVKVLHCTFIKLVLQKDLQMACEYP
jgi:hypothetical protein